LAQPYHEAGPMIDPGLSPLLLLLLLLLALKQSSQ